MEERVKLIAGAFELASVPGRGTRIQASISLAPPRETDHEDTKDTRRKQGLDWREG